jgi:hypothetical protein
LLAPIPGISSKFGITNALAQNPPSAPTPKNSTAAPVTDFSDCAQTEGEKEFFSSLRADSARESETRLQESTCRLSPSHIEAFRTGFSEAFEARKYLPTYGKYELHAAISSRVLPEQRACLTFKTKAPEQLACCMAGYTEGEKGFKNRLRSAQAFAAECSEAFRTGVSEGQENCEVLNQNMCSIAFGPKCQMICYSFGWNESSVKCLPDTSSPGAATARNSRAIPFYRAYEPAAASASSARASTGASEMPSRPAQSSSAGPSRP